MRLLLRISLFIFVFIFILEFSAFIFNKFFRGITYSDIMLEKSSVYKAAALKTSESEENIPELNWIKPELHPYFGYVESKNQNGANNQGFKTNYKYPYKHKKNEFVVGIFGGSVALQLTYNKISRQILEQRIGYILANNGRENLEIVILPFAIGGWRQPQTFFAFSYYFKDLDMIIVLDGYNEIIELKNDNRNWTYRYPSRKIYENLTKTRFTNDKLTLIGQLITLRNIDIRWTNFFSGNIAGKSMFLHTLWYLGNNIINNKIKSLQNALYDYSSDQANKSNKEYEADDQIKDYFELYEQLSTWQSELADLENIPYAQFLQPNQYVKNSKPYSDTEKTLYLKWGDEMTEFVTDNYSALENIFQRMHKNGVHAYSLTRIFSNTNDTVYADDCCHLNTLGLSIMTNKMMDEIEKSGLVERYINNKDYKFNSSD